MKRDFVPTREEVHGGDGLTVIAKKRQPALARICRSWGTPHPARDATLRDFEPQHHEFSMNPGSTPSGILGHHFEDEFPDLFAYRPPADPFPHAGDQPPIHVKASTVPAHHGIGRNYDQHCFPRRAETMKKHPEQLVGASKPGASALSLEHYQLLTKGEIFNEQALPRAKQPKKYANPKPQNAEHGSNC